MLKKKRYIKLINYIYQFITKNKKEGCYKNWLPIEYIHPDLDENNVGLRKGMDFIFQFHTFSENIYFWYLQIDRWIKRNRISYKAAKYKNINFLNNNYSVFDLKKQPVFDKKKSMNAKFIVMGRYKWN